MKCSGQLRRENRSDINLGSSSGSHTEQTAPSNTTHGFFSRPASISLSSRHQPHSTSLAGHIDDTHTSSMRSRGRAIRSLMSLQLIQDQTVIVSHCRPGSMERAEQKTAYGSGNGPMWRHLRVMHSLISPPLSLMEQHTHSLSKPGATIHISHSCALLVLPTRRISMTNEGRAGPSKS